MAVGRDGLGYNIKKTGRELKSVKDLFDPKFKGKVTMLSEPYDSADTVLLGDGVDPRRRRSTSCSARSRRSTRPTKTASSAASPATTTRSRLAKGDIWVALAYSGDLVQLQSDNPDLRFFYPEEGACSSPTT